MKIVLRPDAANAFGPILKQIRERSRQKITQDDLAARVTALGLPIDRTIVSRIENQERKLSDIELLYFSKALRVSMRYICELADQRHASIALYEPGADADELDIKVAEDDPFRI